MDEELKLLPLYPQSSEIYENEAKLISMSFSDSKIRNIGVVAQYGAGKSSLIETFRQSYEDGQYKIHQKLRFLDISLASFNSKNKKNSFNSYK